MKFFQYINFVRDARKNRDGNKTCTRNFESMEHDVTISNGKQYNNFSYCFYFLLLLITYLYNIILTVYCIFNRGALIKRRILRHINSVVKIVPLQDS